MDGLKMAVLVVAAACIALAGFGCEGEGRRITARVRTPEGEVVTHALRSYYAPVRTGTIELYLLDGSVIVTAPENVEIVESQP